MNSFTNISINQDYSGFKIHPEVIRIPSNSFSFGLGRILPVFSADSFRFIQDPSNIHKDLARISQDWPFSKKKKSRLIEDLSEIEQDLSTIQARFIIHPY